MFPTMELSFSCSPCTCTMVAWRRFSSSSSCCRGETTPCCCGGGWLPRGDRARFLGRWPRAMGASRTLAPRSNSLPLACTSQSGGQRGAPPRYSEAQPAGGAQQPPPKPPTPASPYLAPPRQVPGHLVCRQPGQQGVHRLLQLLVALEELPHLRPGVPAAGRARGRLLPHALQRPQLLLLQEGEEEEPPLSWDGGGQRAPVPWSLHGPRQPGEVAGKPIRTPPPSRRVLGALPPHLTCACSCLSISAPSFFSVALLIS